MQASELADVLLFKYKNNDKHYEHQLEYEQDKIIEAFGGLHRLLQLYLTNSIDVNVVNQLHSRLASVTSQQQPSFHTNTINNSHNLESNTTKSLIPSITSQRALFAPEILKVDASDNMYFRIFNSRRKADWFYDRVVKSKYVNIIIYVLLLFSTIIALCFVLFSNNRITNHWFKLYAHCIEWIYILHTIMHILGINIDLMKAITKTFNFIYKAIQVVIILISQTFIVSAASKGYSMFDVITIDILLIVVFTLCLYGDAVQFINLKTKIIMIFLFNICNFLAIIFIYFYIEDVVWDPFDAALGENLTAISLKSVVLNSFINFIILNSKTVIVETHSYFTDRALIKKGYVKSASLLNRPFILWTKYDDNVTDTDYIQTPVADTTHKQQINEYEASVEEEIVEEIRSKPYINEGHVRRGSDGLSVSFGIAHNEEMMDI